MGTQDNNKNSGLGLDFLSSTGSNLITAGINGAINFGLAKWQNKQNLAHWHRQNEYNSPKEQVKRLKEAGLNPYLAYGNGGVSNVAGSAPGAAGAQFTFENPLSYLGQFQQVRKAVAETDNVNQNTLFQAQQTENAYIQSFFERLRNDRQEMENKVYRETLPYRMEEFRLGLGQLRAQIQNTMANTQSTQAQKNLILANTANQLLQNEYFRKDKEWQYKLNQISYDNTKAGINRMLQETRILTQEADTYMEEFNDRMKTNLMNRNYVRQNINKLVNDTRNSSYDALRKQWEYDYMKKRGYYPGMANMVFRDMFNELPGFKKFGIGKGMKK